MTQITVVGRASWFEIAQTVSTKASFKVKVGFLTLDGFFNRREIILRLPFTKTIFGRSESSPTPDYHTEQKGDQTTAQ